jgi:hypothetical protein
MKGFLRNCTAMFTALLLDARASVPLLTPTGSKVRQISTDETKACKSVQTVQYTDTVQETGMSPGLVHEAGDFGLRNEVGRVGVNAFISVQADADWFFGHVNCPGEAHWCPD